MRIRAYLGLGSRYSYLASTQLDGIEARTGATFDWVPINSIELVRYAHTGGSPFDRPTLSGQYDPAYRSQDARRWASHYGIPYHDPRISTLPPSALALACWCVPDPSDRQVLIRDLFDHVFAKDAAVDMEMLSTIAGRRGVARTEIDAALAGHGAAVHHDAALQEAIAAGVFGVPTFEHNGALFWGNDRLVLLEDHLRNGG